MLTTTVVSIINCWLSFIALHTHLLVEIDCIFWWTLWTVSAAFLPPPQSFHLL